MPVVGQQNARERILEATYACVARWGISKTTIEDAAREAGMSRATVYRHFPGGRDELLSATIGWEEIRFFSRLYDELHDAPTLVDMLIRGLPFAHQAILEHQVLQRVLETEPDLLLPKLTIESSRVMALISGFLVPFLSKEPLADGVDVHQAADLLARLILGYITTPGRFDLGDPVQVESLVRTELLGGIVDRTSS
ncbi:MAG: TetR/AcrR family transcriptional regulator [Acidimicrobiales bacterium]